MMLGNESSQEKSWKRNTYAGHKVARDNAVATGKPHGKYAPRWLRPVGKPHPLNPRRRITEAWEVIEERKNVIRQIHQWCWDGLGTYAILKRLNEEKIPYWNKSGRWTLCPVNYHCKTRALTGWCDPNLRLVKTAERRPAGYRNYPPILSDGDSSGRSSLWRRGERRADPGKEWNQSLSRSGYYHGRPAAVDHLQCQRGDRAYATSHRSRKRSVCRTYLWRWCF